MCAGEFINVYEDQIAEWDVSWRQTRPWNQCGTSV